ncbi:MAG TPA: isoprenylcysteine carboxylmethyltransferase family protein [Candidatus Limnocylindrales bacterium]
MDERWLPDLGPRGEGWVAIQAVIFVVIALGGLAGPAWDGSARAVTTVVGVAGLIAGNALAVRGFLDLGPNLTPLPRPRVGTRLVEDGAYGLVRHPIYGGLIIGATGWGLLTASPASLAGAAILFAFFDAKSRREEMWLREAVDGYAGYSRQRRRLIPFVY